MKKTFVLPAVLILLFTVQCIWFIGTQSLVVDEPVHLAMGLESWRNGCFRCFQDHPPLARLLTSAPLLVGNTQIQIDPTGFVTAMSPSPKTIAWRARPVSVALGVLLAGLIWIMARALFSEGGANLALALFAFSPSLIAHFSLATTDGLGTLMIFSTAAAFTTWNARPCTWRTLLFGVVLGALLLAKLYTPPVFLVALLLVVLSRAPSRFRTVLALIGIAGVVVWADTSSMSRIVPSIAIWRSISPGAHPD